jgi:hypothetical protein
MCIIFFFFFFFFNLGPPVAARADVFGCKYVTWGALQPMHVHVVREIYATWMVVRFQGGPLG